MNAAVVNVPGELPKYQSFPDPVAQEGEVLVQVRAAGLHPIVKGLASGTHYASGARPRHPRHRWRGHARRRPPRLLRLRPQAMGNHG